MKCFVGHTLLLDNRHIDDPFGRISLFEKDPNYVFTGEDDDYDYELDFKVEPIKLSKLHINEVRIFEVDELEDDFSCFFVVKAKNKINAILLVCQELSKNEKGLK